MVLEPCVAALPQLSSYLPASSSFSTTSTGINSNMGVKKRRNSIEGAFSAGSPGPPTPHQLKNEQLKRKQPPLQVSHDKGPKTVSFSRLDSIYQAQEQGSPLIISKGLSFSSTAFSKDTDLVDEALQPSTPRRERTSRYLSEGDRREIIARIDGGEKQVTLAREFRVSRAAICNLYKNRWEVLTRGSRNHEAKHPKTKMPRSKMSSTRLAYQPAVNNDTSPAGLIPESITVYPDVSTISIHTEESPREDSVTRHDADESSLSSLGDHHHKQPLTHALWSPFEEIVSSPVATQSFLVHEASTYSYPCRNLIAALRDENISMVVFQQRATRLVRLLIEEALTCLPHEDVQIKNQFGDVCHATKCLDERDICGVSMEDKGMVLLRAFSSVSPTSPTGVVSIEARIRDDNGMSPTIHAQLPTVSPAQVVLLLDIQCATGNEACGVLHHLVHEKQIPAKNIYFVTVISSFEGLQTVFQNYPDVTLIAAQVDTVLDPNQNIRPGIGDFMQRFWNVRTDHIAP